MQMFDFNHFIDSNIIIGYATDFEEIHDKCQVYFNRDIRRRTGVRVYTEVRKVRARRRKLYDDLRKFLTINMNVKEFSPSVRLKVNDFKYLRDLLAELATINIFKVVQYLDRKVRTIEAGIREAFDKILKPFIKPYNYVLLENELDKFIQNMDDSRILSDAICWAEENEKIIFCTNDYKDYLSNKEDIYYGICSIRPYELQDLPVEIVGINEIIL